MRMKTLERPMDETIWPLEDDQARVVTDKPLSLPQFLAELPPQPRQPAKQARSPKGPASNNAGKNKPTDDALGTDTVLRMDKVMGTGSGSRKSSLSAKNNESPALASNGSRADNSHSVSAFQTELPKLDKMPAKNYAPLSPHLHKMMSERRVERNEPPKSHPMPSWVQETIQEQDASERGWVFKGLAIAACLFLVSSVGLTVVTMEFQGSEANPAKSWTQTWTKTWNASLSSLLPTFNTQTTPLKKLPVIGLPAAPKLEIPPAPTQTIPGAATQAKIGSVKLTVEDVQGPARTPIRLEVATQSGESEPPIAVQLTGLPTDAQLSAGSKQSDSSWIVDPSELADLDVILLQRPAAPVKVTVAAIETETGELAAPMQEMMIRIDTGGVIVEPAALTVTNSRNFSSEVTGTTQKVAGEAAVTMRERGDQTLALGDVVGARGFYQKALQMGDVASAARIGRTYDPVVYLAVGVHGLKPDAKMAERWYELAISEGDTGAREDLNRLTQHIAQ